jgi:hypothetical protein
LKKWDFHVLLTNLKQKQKDEGILGLCFYLEITHIDYISPKTITFIFIFLWWWWRTGGHGQPKIYRKTKIQNLKSQLKGGWGGEATIMSKQLCNV